MERKKKCGGASESVVKFYMNSMRVHDYNTQLTKLKRALNRLTPVERIKTTMDFYVAVASEISLRLRIPGCILLTILDDGKLRVHKKSSFSIIQGFLTVRDFDIHVNSQIAVADAKIERLQNNSFPHRLPPRSATVRTQSTGGMPSSSQSIHRIVRKSVGEYNQSLNSLRVLRQYLIPEDAENKDILRNNIRDAMKAYQTKANALYVEILNMRGNKYLAYTEENCKIHIFVSGLDLFYGRFSQVGTEEPKYRVLKNPAKIAELVLIQLRLSSAVLVSLAPSIDGHRLPYPIGDYINLDLPLFSRLQSQSQSLSRLSSLRRPTRVLPIRI